MQQFNGDQSYRYQYGARLLVDAAQLVAHRKVEVERFEMDYLVLSAHKVYAPFGCGVLVARKGLLHFSSEEMELIRSSGEEKAGGIAALGKSMVLLQRIGMDAIREEEQFLTGRPNNWLYGAESVYAPVVIAHISSSNTCYTSLLFLSVSSV